MIAALRMNRESSSVPASTMITKGAGNQVLSRRRACSALSIQLAPHSRLQDSVERLHTLQFACVESNCLGAPASPEKTPRACAVRKNPACGMPVRVLLTHNADSRGRPAATSSFMMSSSASATRRMVFGGSRPRRVASSAYVVGLPAFA